MKPKTVYLAAGAILLSLLLGFTVGGLAVQLSQPDPATNETRSELPDFQYDEFRTNEEYRALDTAEPPVESTRSPPNVTATFGPVSDENELFGYDSHDAAFLRTRLGNALFVNSPQGKKLYVSDDVTTDGTEWRPVRVPYAKNEMGSTSIDTVVTRNGTYIAYLNGRVYTRTNLTTGRWHLQNVVGFPKDPGVYYDGETGRYHMYYEHGFSAGHSGSKIGHATSPNGVTNWTVYEPVWDAPPSWGVGDFDVVRIGEYYLLVGDYTDDHPRYNVGMWVNDNLYSNFTYVGTALERRPETTPYIGIQDPELVRDGENNRFVLYAHGEESPDTTANQHAYAGRIILNETTG